MTELLGQLLSPELMAVVIVVVVLVVALYLLSIVWVARDAKARGAGAVWTIVAIIPVVGLVAYCLLRPSMYTSDREELELEMALKQRKLMKYGECASCGYPVESDYVLCPNCHTRLKNLCPTCNHALDPTWSVCPYCTTTISNAGPRVRRGMPQGAAMAAPRGNAAAQTQALQSAPAPAPNPAQAQARPRRRSAAESTTTTK